jgi:hypothetical protein
MSFTNLQITEHLGARDYTSQCRVELSEAVSLMVRVNVLLLQCLAFFKTLYLLRFFWQDYWKSQFFREKLFRMMIGFSSAPKSKIAKSRLEKYRVFGIEKAKLMLTCLFLL